MDGFTWTAFICYLVSVVGGIIFGIVYLTRSKFMPYHREALGQNWDQIDRGQQALIIGSMRVIGGSLLGTNLGIMVMLLIPFRSGEMWSYYAIPAIGLIASLPILYGLLIVRLRARARPPVAVTAASCALIIIGFILSFF